MKYILILIVYLNGYPSSQAVTTAEFVGKKACINAGEEAKSIRSPFYGDMKAEYICVEAEPRKSMVVTIDQQGIVKEVK